MGAIKVQGRLPRIAQYFAQTNKTKASDRFLKKYFFPLSPIQNPKNSAKRNK